MKHTSLFLLSFVIVAGCGGSKPPTRPEPRPDPDTHGEIACTAELSLPCAEGSADGCLDGRTVFHVCVQDGQTGGPSCEQEIAKVCDEGQVDACLATPALATTHLCVYPNAAPVPAANRCPESQGMYFPGCGSGGEITLEVEGCYATCAAGPCGAGFACKKVVTDPCHDSACDACGSETDLCVPAS